MKNQQCAEKSYTSDVNVLLLMLWRECDVLQKIRFKPLKEINVWHGSGFIQGLQGPMVFWNSLNQWFIILSKS